MQLRPRGTYLIDTPVFLDSEDPFDCMVLFGNGATLELGAGLARTDAFTTDPSTRWAFFPNTRRSAYDGDAVAVDVDHRATGPSVGGTPRLVVHQLHVCGQSSNRGFAFFNRCAGRLNDVVMEGARGLVSWFDYCDAMVLDHCQGRIDEVPDAWLLHQVANGDGIVLLSPKTERSIGAASLNNAKGASIVAPVSGAIRVVRSRAVSIVAGHAEADLQAGPPVTVRSSQVTIDASVLYAGRSEETPGILVDDSDAGLATQLTLRDVGQLVLHRDGSTTVRAERQGDVLAAPVLSLAQVQPGTRVLVTGAHSLVGSRQLGSRWLPSVGFRITSADPDVAAALETDAARWQRATGHWALRRSGGWVVTTPGGEVTGCPALSSPELLDVRASVDGVVGALAADAVEYVAALRDAAGNHTDLSGVLRSEEPQAGSVRVSVRLSGPAVLVLWRSSRDVRTSPDVTVVLPVPGPEVVAFDTGGHFGGVPWVPATGAPPAAVAAVNGTRQVLLLAGRPM